jgi:hypothetical protein
MKHKLIKFIKFNWVTLIYSSGNAIKRKITKLFSNFFRANKNISMPSIKQQYLTFDDLCLTEVFEKRDTKQLNSRLDFSHKIIATDINLEKNNQNCLLEVAIVPIDEVTTSAQSSHHLESSTHLNQRITHFAPSHRLH